MEEAQKRLLRKVIQIDHPEPPPAEGTISEGQGTLSPPSEAAGESVFGSGQVSEAVPDEELSVLLSNTWHFLHLMVAGQYMYAIWKRIRREASMSIECRRQA